MLKVMLLLLLAVSSCAPKAVKMDTPMPRPPVYKAGYSYRQVSESDWLIFSTNNNDLERAKLDIGCGVCASQHLGSIVHVRVY